MTTASAQTEAKIDKLLRDIALAFGVPCSFFDPGGSSSSCCGFESRSNFCRFIHFYDTRQICRQSYLQSFRKAETSREPLAYFCPFGLVNITFPLFFPGRESCFVTTGPLLYTAADDQLITNVLDLNCLLRPRAREVRQLLGEIMVKDEDKVASMTAVIQNALKGTTPLLGDGGQTVRDRYAKISDDIRVWHKANPNQEEDDAFARLRTKVLPDPTAADCRREQLEEVFLSFGAFIFAGNDFSVTLGRIFRYLELLAKLALDSGIDPAHCFPTEEIDIDKLIAAHSPELLRHSLARINYVFLRQYLESWELRNRDVIFRAMHYIRGHYDNISLADVADVVHLHPTYFSNCFKKATGQSYSAYLNKIRIEESKKLLLAGNSLAQIAQQVGFSDQSYFTNVFKKIEGVSPKRWINAQKQMEAMF